jgi:hypothetical protein
VRHRSVVPCRYATSLCRGAVTRCLAAAPPCGVPPRLDRRVSRHHSLLRLLRAHWACSEFLSAGSPHPWWHNRPRGQQRRPRLSHPLRVRKLPRRPGACAAAPLWPRSLRRLWGETDPGAISPSERGALLRPQSHELHSLRRPLPSQKGRPLPRANAHPPRMRLPPQPKQSHRYRVAIPNGKSA